MTGFRFTPQVFNSENDPLIREELSEDNTSYLFVICGDSSRHFTRHFAHQGEDVSFGILKVREPQIVRRHGRHEVRLHNELDAAGIENFVNLLDVIDFVVDDGRGMIDLGPVGSAQHDANVAAFKEGHAGRRGEKKPHPEHVAVKSDRAVEILNVDENLPDLRQGRSDGYWRGHHLVSVTFGS